MWDQPVTVLKGVGAAKAKLLAGMGIPTLGALLTVFPRGYCDLDGGGGLAGAKAGEWMAAVVQIKGRPVQVSSRREVTLTRCDIRDATGRAQCLWFHNRWVIRQIDPQKTYLVIGRADFYEGTLQLVNPDMEEWQDQPHPPILPLYALPRGISQRTFRGLVAQALTVAVGSLPDPLPGTFRARHHLCERNYALEQVHFPSTQEACAAARERLGIEEMMLYMLALRDIRRLRSGLAGAIFPDGSLLQKMKRQLGFPLTHAQERVLEEIYRDMASTSPMNRLVQGDVGCGKTAVALMALAMAAREGRQAAYMAPTDLLAHQVYAEADKLLSPLGYKVGLLTAGGPASGRKALRDAMAAGDTDIVVGTHALLSKTSRFRQLAMAVVDEQHRFGVKQRKKLEGKALAPHLLVMSATPVPRSLALVLYGDLEVSVVDELPPGRKSVITRLVPEAKREDMFRYIAQEAALDHRTYIVCPAIEDAEGMPMKSANQLYAELASGPLKGLVGKLHGRMPKAEQDQVLEAFRRGDCKAIVATTVVEVGVNVPEATIMVIENADRFGLAQLHQLRGRVGRGKEQGYCFLLTSDAGEAAMSRLHTMVTTQDGFQVAEQDMQLRGPGELLGTRQAGVLDPRLMAMIRDGSLLQKVASMTEEILSPAMPEKDRQVFLDAARNRYAPMYEDIIMN